MKKFSLPINNETPETVNLSAEDYLEAKRLQDDPEFMLKVVDLIFGFEDGHLPPS